MKEEIQEVLGVIEFFFFFLNKKKQRVILDIYLKKKIDS